MIREPGFYWVLISYKTNWIIAEFNEGGTWSFCGFEDIIQESKFVAIDETRIRHVNDE